MSADTSSIAYLDRMQAESLAHQIADSLADRSFTKHPHIGLIGPSTRWTGTDQIDLLTETVEEQTEQWLSPFVTGFRVALRPIQGQDERRIKVCYSFSIRIAPPTPEPADGNGQFRSIDLCLIIKNRTNAEASLAIYDSERKKLLYSKEVEIELADGRFFLRIPQDLFADARQLLTTVAEVGYRGSGPCAQISYFIYGFNLTASLTNISNNKFELAVMLMEEDGNFIDPNGRIVEVTDQNRRCRLLVDANNEPWSIAQLLEIESTARVEGYEFLARPTPYGIAGLRPINCAYSLETLQEGEIRFRDYAVVPERGRTIKKSTQKIEDFLAEAIIKYRQALRADKEEAYLLAKTLATALRPLIDNSSFLYTFQENCTLKILDCIAENPAPASAVPMGVQTAGGKTLGFLIPISIFSFFAKKKQHPSGGVKALLFYPTKALINDQSDTIVNLLWRLNRGLRSKGQTDLPLTFGLLHGDTERKREVSNRMSRTGQQELTELIRLKCPVCGSPLQVNYQLIGGSGITERVTCSSPESKQCPLAVDEEEVAFFNSMIRITRESVFSDPPDILVCTPDMVNYRLFYNPSEQAIFGRRIKRCPTCGYTTANLRERGPCKYCRTPLEGELQFSVPKILVFDEAHQLRGSFGSQVSHVMSRFEQAIKTLTGVRDYRPIYVFSSATLARPSRFIRDFFGHDVHTKELVRAEYLQDVDIVQRMHLFIVPKGYSPEATLIQTIKAIFNYFPFRERHPNILVFVNSLAESNELVYQLRHHMPSFRQGREDLPAPVIDGHTTDYGSEQRVEVEDAFTRGEINILVATTTLQVGVDFDRIDALIIYGAPFYLSDYIQRMGRAGRKHAAVIVSILPSKPVDFFFFGNYPLITNLEVRDQALNAEAVRISRENETIRQRSSVRALLDYLCTYPNSSQYYKDISRPRGLGTLLNAVFTQEIADKGSKALEYMANLRNTNPDLLAYIEGALRSQLTTAETQAVLRTVNELFEQMVSRGITSLSALFSQRTRFLERIYAGNLRQSDHTVKVEHPDLIQLEGRGRRRYTPWRDDTTRERALGIAIGDYAHGQITSYRGLFFVVDYIESDPTMSSQIRSLLYRHDTLGRREDL